MPFNCHLKESMEIQLRIRKLEREANLKKSVKQNATEIIESCEESINDLIKKGFPDHHADVQFYKKLINSMVKYV